jgi:transcriptional regulator with XRE-family HTH domain
VAAEIGEAILKAMKDHKVSQAYLVKETGLGKGTVGNFIRGKVDRKTKQRSPWCGEISNLLKIANVLGVDVLTLVIREPLAATPAIAGVEFFSSTVVVPVDPRLGLLNGQMEIEADLDMNGNSVETNRDWTLRNLIGKVGQLGSYVAFSAERVEDNGLIFESIMFQGQLLEGGRFMSGTYEFRGGDRWQYGVIMATRLARNPLQQESSTCESRRSGRRRRKDASLYL